MTGYAQFVSHDGKAIATGGAPTLGVSFDPDQRALGAPVGPGRAAHDRQRRRHGRWGRPRSTTSRWANGSAILLEGPTADLHHHGLGALRHGRQPGRRHPGRLRHVHGPGCCSGEVGKFDHINVVAHAGSRQAACSAPSLGPCPAGVEVVTGQTVVNEADERDQPGARASSRPHCLVFAFIALFVGGFTILNTFSIIVGQRTRELALLRIVGASRRQVFRSVLGEAAIVGLLSSLIGLGLGVLAALGLEELLKGFGLTLPSGPLVFEARTVVVVPRRRCGRHRRLRHQSGPPGRAHRPRRGRDRAARPQPRSRSRRRFTRGGAVALVGAVALAFGLSAPAIAAGRPGCRR